MEYHRNATDEGWKTLAVTAAVSVLLLFGTLIFDMGTIGRSIWSILVLAISSIGVGYTVVNIRSGGVFRCHLTAHEFIQEIPVQSCGENFRIRLDTITKIERHDTGGEGPSEEWYLHTDSGRYRITSNYENPVRKFVEALRNYKSEIEIVET